MSEDRRYDLIGFASDIGGRLPGAAEGPDAIRELELVQRLKASGADIEDLGNVTSEDEAEVSDEIVSLVGRDEQAAKNIIPSYLICDALAARVAEALEDGRTPLILGGSHICSMGTVAAVSNYCADRGEKIGLIWVDAHPDIHTPKTSISKNMHGMCTAVLLGLVPGLMQRITKSPPAVSFKNMVYIGLRDVDDAERKALKRRSLTKFTIDDIEKHGMSKVISDAVARASHGTAGFVVSFDVDVFDPKIAPATGVPYPGGLSSRQGARILKGLAESGKVLAYELVELNPKYDQGRKTAKLAVDLMDLLVRRKSV